MRSSRKSDEPDELDGLLSRISSELAREESNAELRISRLETLLRLTAEILSTYGMNIYTLAMHQVEILKQVAALESAMTEMSRAKTQPLPAARRRSSDDDYN